MLTTLSALSLPFSQLSGNPTVAQLGSGGTNSYVLTDVSGTATWQTPGGSSPLTTKGDIYGYTTTNARVPVGADGTVLGADSTQALGVGYKDMPSVLITDPPYNAACDGSTDDSTAIQAAINSGKVVNFPLSTPSDFQQCNVATPLTGPSSGSPLVIHGNGCGVELHKHWRRRIHLWQFKHIGGQPHHKHSNARWQCNGD